MLHVFFITSPIVEIISSSYIKDKKIQSEDILLISLRGYQFILNEYEVVRLKPSLLSRVIFKLFKVSSLGLLLLLRLVAKNRKYIIYCPWDMPEVVSASWSKNFLGCYYIEEGTMSMGAYGSYFHDRTFRFELRRIAEWRQSHKRGIKDDLTRFNSFYDSNCLGFIKLVDGSFPDKIASKVKKIKFNLENFSHYKFTLKDTQNIVILPSTRRLEGAVISSFVDKMLQQVPSDCAFKFHPNFELNVELKEEIKREISKHIDAPKFCGNETIIELEMAVCKKTLYGPLSSLKIYAEHFGSEYVHVDIY